jgi:two-component system, chemotaxis family, chemotaxis protein CheY
MSERMKVLVVDDDVVSRMVLMHLVATSGEVEVLEAEDGEEAWGLLDGGIVPAVVFCDLRMPRLSGMELLARVMSDERFAGLPFVLASAADERATVDQASGLGAHGYLVKPFDPEAVRALLAGLARPREEQATEAPAQTLRRLGIDAARLLLYLGGLHRQLGEAGPQVEELLACGDKDGARERLTRLHEGCATLGLRAAAAALQALAAQAAPSTGEVLQALEEARHSAVRQGELARALPPA